MIIMDDPEETLIFDQLHQDMEDLWRNALAGHAEPAIVAYTLADSGQITYFHFQWTVQSAELRRTVEKAMLDLGPYSGVKSQSRCTEFWLGVAPENKERWMLSQATSNASALATTGKLDVAEVAWHEAVAEAEEIFGSNFPVTAATRMNLAFFYWNIGRHADYEREMKDTISRYQFCFEQSPTDYGSTLRNCNLEMAKYFDKLGRDAEAEQYYIRCIAINEVSNNFQSRALDPLELGKFFEKRNRLVEAEKAFCLAVANMRIDDSKKEQPWLTHCDNLAELGDFYIRRERFSEAESCYERLLKIYSELEAPISFKSTFDWFAGWKAMLAMQGRTDALRSLDARLTPIEINAGRRSSPRNSWGYVDRDGQMRIEPRYRHAGDFSEGLARVQLDAQGSENKRWTFIDASGQSVFEHIFSAASDFRGGMAQVSLSGEKTSRMIDRQGNLLPEQFISAEPYSDGMSAVTLRRTDPKLHGYMNVDRQVILKPQFTTAQPFVNGRAIVGVGGSEKACGCVIRMADIAYGVIDKSGEWLVPAKYAQLKRFGDDFFFFVSGEGYGGLLDLSGKVVLTLPGAEEFFEHTEGLASIDWKASNDAGRGHYGFISTEGKIAIEPIFDFAYPFKEGLSLVRYQGKSGFIDKSGAYIVEAKYEDAHEFFDGLAAVVLSGTDDNKLWGYIDREDKVVIPACSKWGREFSCGMAVVGNATDDGDKYGYIDKTGKSAFDGLFDTAGAFEDGRAKVGFKKGKRDSRLGIINEKGEFILEPEYVLLNSYSEGLAAVCKEPIFGTIVTSTNSSVSFSFS